jgi:hypothetical protein
MAALPDLLQSGLFEMAQRGEMAIWSIALDL